MQSINENTNLKRVGESCESVFLKRAKTSTGYENQRVMDIKDIMLEVFSHLNFNETLTCCQVSQKWNEVGNDPFLLKKLIYQFKVFNSEDWTANFGKNHDRSSESHEAFDLLPLNIGKIFKSESIAFPGDKWGMMHTLVFIPAGLTINGYLELLRGKSPKYTHEILSTSKFIDEHFGDVKFEKSKWVAMTKQYMPKDSDNKSFNELLLDNCFVNYPNYRVPKILEAVVSISVPPLKQGLTKINVEEKLITHCEEMVLRWRTRICTQLNDRLSIDYGKNLNQSSCGVFDL